MKKILFAISAGVVLFACTKEAPAVQSEEGLVCTLQQPEGTKALSGSFAFSFSEGDCINIVRKGYPSTVMNYGMTVDKAQPSRCKVQINGYTLADDNYFAFYPAMSFKDAGTIALSFEKQVQKAAGNADHLAAYDYSRGETAIASNSGNFALKHLVGWLKLCLTLPANETVTYVKLQAPGKVFSKSVNLDLESGSLYLSPDSYEMSLGLGEGVYDFWGNLVGTKGISVSSGREFVSYLTLPAGTDLSKFYIEVVTKSGKSYFSEVIAGGAVGAGRYVPITKRLAYRDKVNVKTESDFQDAIQQNDALIVFDDDITLTDFTTLNKDVTIDLKGHKLSTGTMDGHPVSDVRPFNIASEVSIRNGSIVGPGIDYCYAIVNVLSGGDAHFENVEITTDGIPVQARQKNAVATIGEGCVLKSVGTTSNSTDYPYGAAATCCNGGTLNIEGGELSGKYYAVSIFTSGGYVNVSGGKLKAGGTGCSVLNDARNNLGVKEGIVTVSSDAAVVGGNLKALWAGHPAYINVQGGTFDSGCQLINFQQSQLTVNSSKYSLTDLGSNCWGLSRK